MCALVALLLFDMIKRIVDQKVQFSIYRYVSKRTVINVNVKCFYFLLVLYDNSESVGKI